MGRALSAAMPLLDALLLQCEPRGGAKTENSEQCRIQQMALDVASVMRLAFHCVGLEISGFPNHRCEKL